MVGAISPTKRIQYHEFTPLDVLPQLRSHAQMAVNSRQVAMKQCNDGDAAPGCRLGVSLKAKSLLKKKNVSLGAFGRIFALGLHLLTIARTTNHGARTGSRGDFNAVGLAEKPTIPKDANETTSKMISLPPLTKDLILRMGGRMGGRMGVETG